MAVARDNDEFAEVSLPFKDRIAKFECPLGPSVGEANTREEQSDPITDQNFQ